MAPPLPSTAPPLTSTAPSGPSSSRTDPLFASTLPPSLHPTSPSPPPSSSISSNEGGAAEAAALAAQGTKGHDVLAAVVSSPLGSVDAHGDNEDNEGSVGPEISCRYSQKVVACEVRRPHAGRRHPPLLLVAPRRPRHGHPCGTPKKRIIQTKV
ncbi:hypothetical protein D1007_46132 [Hordeum vulgare]|nr:hypothetical protein D1007_46132 [Hordeum vulgare]